MSKLILLPLLTIFFCMATQAQKPALVLVLVYDQFRADYLTRWQKQLLPAQPAKNRFGGFRYLMEKGAYFPLAQYEVLQSMTCPGHAMILTGSYPYSNGIAMNEWYDNVEHRIMYCVEDARYRLSPRRLQGSTVGDELKLIHPQSKVVSVAIKDRSAIMLGGHSADVALWLNWEKMEWESSEFYQGRADLSWLPKFNSHFRVLRHQTAEWKSSAAAATAFHHSSQIPEPESLGYPTAVEWTQQAALQLLQTYQLGQHAETDLLAVSFSSHDISGHHFGPNSPEMQELTLQEDKKLADFLTQVNAKVPGGLKNVLIVMTADHGIAPLASTAQSLGLDAGTIDQDQIMAELNTALKKKFSAEDQVLDYQYLNFYLSEHARKSNPVVEFCRQWLLQKPGVAYVVTPQDVYERKLPPGLFAEQLSKSYVPHQHGDLFLIPKSFWYEYSKKNVATHMTGYSYDSTVPVLMAGPGIIAGQYAEKIHVVDIAPTLSFVLGQVPPALSEGRVLSEIFKH